MWPTMSFFKLYSERKFFFTRACYAFRPSPLLLIVTMCSNYCIYRMTCS